MGAGVTRKRLVIGLIAVIALALIVAWFQRIAIATSITDAQFEARKVAAQYKLTRIGPTTQRLEGLVLGDPKAPDLTAKWIEIDLNAGFSGVSVRAIRADGVRLRGRVVDGKLSFGVVDKLLPAPTGEPFALPNINAALRDVEVSLDTPAGLVGIGLNGSGNLRGGFKGQAALNMPALLSGDCRATGLKAAGTIDVAARKPGFDGPIALASANCAGVRVGQTSLATTVHLGEPLDSWAGKIDAKMASATLSGAALTGLNGTVSFDGTLARTRGQAMVIAATLNTSQVTGRDVAISAPWEAGVEKDSVFASSAGTFALTRAVPGPALAGLSRQLNGLGAGTPIAPIAASLGNAVAGLSGGSDMQGRFVLDHRGNAGRLVLSGLNATSASGARLAVRGEAPVIIRWPGGVAIRADAALNGGGFPQSTISFDGDNGTLRMAPISAGGSRLALTPVAFRFSAGGVGVRTVATLDGPLGSGRVEGLTVPIALAPGQSLPSGCTPVAFRRLQVDTLTLNPATLRTCLGSNRVRIESPRLTGRLGQSPLSVVATSANYALDAGRFALERAAVQLGPRDQQTRLDLASLEGRVQNGRISGRFGGASGKIGAVPILASDGGGDWAFAGGKLTLSGALRVADASPDPRYFPLVMPDMKLTMAGGRIDMTGTARHPKSGTEVAQVSVLHRLGPGTGEAVLNIRDLRFGQALQPEELTPITLGVIANVRGGVAGRGVIRWTPDGVKSEGGFRTDGMDMAAAFGPVEGLAGEIALSDLLGLETPPTQEMRIATINPGILVTDGVVKYQMLPDLRMAIEGGEWPFAGGKLTLKPAILDLNQQAVRRLTFGVEGLDAARFIAAMQFENIAATGTFDGELPMIFDKNGGRIEGGTLVARAGGTVSYVGEVSNEQLGAYGRIAFDALKALRYDRLSIDLDGALDGDVITRIRLAGVSQAPIEGVRATLPIPVRITGIDNFPFIFNITITAKFRQLFEMAKSFNDPSILINRALPQLEPVLQTPQKQTPPPVQPLESAPNP